MTARACTALDRRRGAARPTRAGPGRAATTTAPAARSTSASPAAGGARDDRHAADRLGPAPAPRLLGEVGDPDAVRAPGLDAGLDGRARRRRRGRGRSRGRGRRRRAASRRARRAPCAAPRRAPVVGVGEQVHHLVRRPAGVAGAALGGPRRERRPLRAAPRRSRRSPPPRRVARVPAPEITCDEGLQDQDVAGGAGVDDPGAGQRRQLVGGASSASGRRRAAAAATSYRRGAGAAAARLGGGGGRGATVRMVPSTGRVTLARARSLARRSARASVRPSRPLGTVRRLADDLAQPAHQLAEDDPGVAAGGQQRGAGQAAASRARSRLRLPARACRGARRRRARRRR